MKSILLKFSLFSQVIAAEGEQKASRALREASNTIAESSSALQLRYLQVSLPGLLRQSCDQDLSDLEFYISREEFHDNISNTFRYNVQLYEVSYKLSNPAFSL